MIIKCPWPPPTKPPKLPLNRIAIGKRFFRVGSARHPIVAWDDRTNTNYRFSPLKDSAGAVVPVSYSGETPDVALLESILRFTPEGAGGHIDRSHYQAKCIAEVESTRELNLISLCGPGARLLRRNWAVAISHAFAEDYATTQKWSAWFFKNYPSADGIEWISTQQLRNTSILLWQRSKSEAKAPLKAIDGPFAIDSMRVFGKLCSLATRAGHTIDF